MAEQIMSLGFYISLAGPVTFKKAKELKEIATIIPDDYLLVETTRRTFPLSRSGESAMNLHISYIP